MTILVYFHGSSNVDEDLGAKSFALFMLFAEELESHFVDELHFVDTSFGTDGLYKFGQVWTILVSS